MFRRMIKRPERGLDNVDRLPVTEFRSETDFRILRFPVKPRPAKPSCSKAQVEGTVSAGESIADIASAAIARPFIGVCEESANSPVLSARAAILRSREFWSEPQRVQFKIGTRHRFAAATFGGVGSSNQAAGKQFSQLCGS